MKTNKPRNNIAVLDIGKTHAKVILFDAITSASLCLDLLDRHCYY